MNVCIYVEDNTPCHVTDYESDIDKYRGSIVCCGCKQKAWYVRSFFVREVERGACFAAHHLEGCDVSSVGVATEEDDNEDSVDNTDLVVDLDKSKAGPIYASKPGDKVAGEDNNWNNENASRNIGNGSGYPLNKSLRQLLTHLVQNAAYAERDISITIKADSGREVLSGQLRDYLVHFDDIDEIHQTQLMIFWGRINNFNYDKQGQLWLNSGNYRTEPSILANSAFAEEIRVNFKLADIAELQGADVIVVGRVGFSNNNKPVIRCSFTKYMSFRRVRIVERTTEPESVPES